MLMRNNNRQLGQNGMISMITVTLMGLILTIVTTGFLHIITRNQRQANDAQASLQAFYAAETGIEDAKRAINLRQRDIVNGTKYVKFDASANINTNPEGSNTNCEPAQTQTGTPVAADLPANVNRLDGNGNVEYTCQLIDVHPDTLNYDIRAFEQRVANLQVSSGSFSSIKVTWEPLREDTTAHTMVNNAPADYAQLQPVTGWGTLMAMLKLQLTTVKKPSGAGLTRDQFQRNERTYFVSPVDGGTGSINVTYCSFDSSDACGADTAYNTGVQPGKCSSVGGRILCEVTFKLQQPVAVGTTTVGGTVAQDIDANFISKLQITSLYQGAHVEVQLLDGAAVQETANAQALIDVTGRSGNVFRRLRVHYPLSNDSFPFPTFGVQSAEDICKLLDVRPSNPATPATGGVITNTCPSF